MGEEIRISVRDLVEFVLRSGDLDERAAGASEEAMLEGARMHRRLQREAGPDYTAEVPMAILYPSSHAATYCGIISGGSWKSAAMRMVASPVDCSIA